MASLSKSENSPPSIIAIPFLKFKELGEFGRLGLPQERREELGLSKWEILKNLLKHKAQRHWKELALQVGESFLPATDVFVEITEIDRGESFNIMISHCWMRGHEKAPGYDKRPHTDDPENNKYKLCVEGIERLWKAMAPGLPQCYVWIDFSCINQDGDPSGELRQLASIVAWADCLFTPIVDLGYLSWTLPSPLSSEGYFKDYKAPLWNQGDFAYLNRCWCRLEMLYCLIPLLDEAMSPSRLERVQAGLQHALSNNRRLHVLFGTKELNKVGKVPIALPPLQFSWFDKYNPEEGTLTQETDRAMISAEVKRLERYKQTVEEGYVGEKNAEGQAHGRGIWTYASGNVYEGEFNDGKREGQGVYRWASGNVYEGEFKNDSKDGHGVLRYASGDVYVGEFKNDKKEGQGMFRWADGRAYEGQWKDGKQDGQGMMKYASGEIYEGLWRNGSQEGHGVYRFADGDVYEGQYKTDQFLVSCCVPPVVSCCLS